MKQGRQQVGKLPWAARQSQFCETGEVLTFLIYEKIGMYLIKILQVKIQMYLFFF